MADSLNPLLDDDEDETISLASLPELNKNQPKTDIGVLPELPSLPDGLPEIDLSEVLDGMGDGESLPSDHEASLDDPFSHVDNEVPDFDDQDDEPITPVPEPFASDSIDDLLINLDDLNSDDEEDYSSSGIRTLDDYATPQSHEDEMDFEGASLDLDAVIALAIEAGASDVHVTPYDEISFSVLGEIRRVSEFGEVDANMTTRLQQTIISNVLEQMFVEDLELDTSYVVKSGKYKGRRTRLSIGKTGGEIFLVFRIIAETMPTPDELEIPQSMRDWVNLPNGLILVNGPTGSGKSTTLSSLIQEIQFNRPDKIITIEKPVEFVYGVKPGQKALIVQREVGRDARSFSNALTSAMRQAPNIILVGEVRNRLEIDELLRAAETGHLAISTLHTTSCPATINRIRSMYEGDEQLRVLATLADNLRGMMTQTLVKTPDGSSRFAVREVLQVDAEVKEMVLVGDVAGISQYMKDREQTMAHELVRAVKSGRVRYRAARDKAPEPLYFDQIAKAEGVTQ